MALNIVMKYRLLTPAEEFDIAYDMRAAHYVAKDFDVTVDCVYAIRLKFNTNKLPRNIGKLAKTECVTKGRYDPDGRSLTVQEWVDELIKRKALSVIDKRKPD
jgi:hypothetical protein